MLSNRINCGWHCSNQLFIINRKILKMRTLFAAAAVGMLQTAFADYTLLPPPSSATGDDTAIVWIHGADCDNDAYVTFANEIQSQGGQRGQRLWVGLPEFVLSTPEPILIDHYVT